MATDKRIKNTKKKKADTPKPPRVQTTQPWSQHSSEGILPYTSFCAYRDMGPARTLAKLAKRGYDVQDGKAKVVHRMTSISTLTAYSRTYDWVHRATAWDRYQDKIRQKEMSEASRKAARRSFRIAQLCQTTSWKVLQAIAKRIDTDALLIKRFDPKDLMDMFTRVAKLQKDLQAMNLLTFGEPTSITAESAPTAPGGLFATSQDFMTIVRSNSKTMELFSQLTAEVSLLRAETVVKPGSN